jgi:hypothetical protein
MGNWILIDQKELFDEKYREYTFFLKTARISHTRELYRSLLPLNETPNNPTVPSVSTCTCTAPAGRRTKICNSCDHYEIESQTCERYPRGLAMENVVKWKCGEHKIINGELK